MALPGAETMFAIESGGSPPACQVVRSHERVSDTPPPVFDTCREMTVTASGVTLSCAARPVFILAALFR